MHSLFYIFATSFLIHATLGSKNLNVTTKIDVRGLVVRVEHEVVFDGTEKEYDYSVHPSEVPHISLLSASYRNGKTSTPLTVTQKSSRNYAIRLPDRKDGPFTFTVAVVLTGVLEPKPREILQKENQYLKFSGNIMYYSPYPSDQVETHVILPQGELLRYTDAPAPVTKQGKKLTYGPYHSIQANSHVPLYVHFENNRPLMAVTKMTRTIEISHWGNVAVEENLEIKNVGATLRGSFSRLDFDMGHGQQNAVVAFKTALPAAAKHIYYRDEIGNISTSTVLELSDLVEVTLYPRFPLMGGWKTQYTLGYNVPAHEFLYRTGSQFTLRMRFLDHIYDDQLVEDLTVKIVLPELVHNIDFRPPFPMEKLPGEVLKTYLDTVGRTVLVYRAKNLVMEHIKEFTLNYEFNMIYILREPLMLVLAFATIFACALVYVRLDFSIFKDEKAELRLRVQAIVDEAQEIYQKRSSLYQAYEDAIGRYKSKKDSSQLATDKKNLEADHKQLNQSLAKIQARLAEFYTDGVEKLKELSNLDSSYRDLIQESFQLAERLISGKITKPQYRTSDQELSSKKSELVSRMDAVVDSL